MPTSSSSMVPDTPDVEAVLFGENGVAAGLQGGRGGRAQDHRRHELDLADGDQGVRASRSTSSAPTTSTRRSPAARSAPRRPSLTIMCGGEPAVFERVRPLLEKMGKNITLVGGNGDGQTTKVANQIIVALNIAAVGEALLFASKAGADPAKVRQALMGGFAASRILEVHGERMIKRTFDPGFRIRLHQKDLGLALQGARELGVSLPQTASAAQLMQACAANGMADLDHSALVKALELMAGHEVAKG